MPFNNATNQEANFVESGKYIGKVVRTEESDEGGFGPGLKWVWHLATPNPQGKATTLFGTDGEPYEFYQWSSLKLSPRAKARGWVEALLDRPLEDGESGEAISQAIVGKVAMLLIGPQVGEDGQTRMKIMSIEPYRASGRAAPKPEPTPEPVAAGVAAGADDDPFAE